MKYKVGDLVKVREDLVHNKFYDDLLFVPDMFNYRGKYVRIKECCTALDGTKFYEVEGTNWRFSDSMFEGKYDWKISEDALRRYDAIIKAYIEKHYGGNMKDFKIVNYEVHDNDGVKTVVVEFGDGTKEHAVCCKEDTFDLRTGIEVCVCKHVFGGNDKYKSALRSAMSQIKAIDKAKADKEKEEELIARKKAKNERRKARHKANRRARRVAEMKEAYLAALREHEKEECSCDVLESLL